MSPGVFRAVFVLALAAFSGSLAARASTNRFFQFVQDQGERHYTQVPHEVLSTYYGWFVPKSWSPVTNASGIGRRIRRPMKGPYDSHDASVVDRQIDEAKAHGITCFVVSWFGTGPEAANIERTMQLVVERAEKKDFKVSILWEQAPGEGRHMIDRAIFELSYALKRYGKSKSFLKVDGKPVVVAYERVHRKIPLKDWPDVIEGVRAKAGDFLLMADGYHPQLHASWLVDGVSDFDFEFMPGHLRSDPGGKNAQEFPRLGGAEVRGIRAARSSFGADFLFGNDSRV